MKKNDIRVGGLYRAKVSRGETTVRVDAIRENYKGRTVYEVTNLATKRTTTFYSAAKFRAVAEEAEQRPDPTPAPTTPAPAPSVEQTDTTAATATMPSPDSPKTVPAIEAKEHQPGDPGFDPSIIKTRCRCRRCRDIRAGVPVAAIDPTQRSREPKTPFVPTVATQEPTPTIQPDKPTVGTAVESSPTPSSAPAISAKLAGKRMAEVDRPVPLGKLASLLAEKKATESAPLAKQIAGLTPTEEQAAILELARKPGLKVLVVVAGAGTGKTKTEEMLEKVLPGRGQYTAFNAPLVAEGKTKFVKAACNTGHSLAWRAVGYKYARRLPPIRMRSDQLARILGIGDLGVHIEGQEQPKILSAGFLAGQVIVAVRRFCQSAEREITHKHFRYIEGIDMQVGGGKARYGENNVLVRNYLLPFAKAAWEDLRATDGKLPFNHDCYVKVWQLGEGPDRPIINADYILLDEAQDTAPVMLDILKQQSHALLVFVGDSNQQIYDWRGAVDAMRAFPDAPRRLLSQSFRFGQSVADVANSILGTLEEKTDLVLKGLPTIPSRVAAIKEPRCILCRTNACAVGHLLRGIKEEKRPYLVGGGSDVIAFCKGARALMSGQKTTHPDLCCFDRWSEVQEYVKTDEGEDLKLMVRLIDEFGVDVILNALENMPSERDADLVISTAHKSKGREWDSVKLAQDFPPVEKMGDSEKRLLYVAATRAKLMLDISECPSFIGERTREDGEGETLPGLEVNYTSPMPTEEELAEYVAKKATTAVAEKHEEKKAGNGDVPNGFTWTKHAGQWVIRGPANHENRKVRVSRRSGDSQVKETGKALAKYDNAWVYEVK